MVARGIIAQLTSDEEGEFLLCHFSTEDADRHQHLKEMRRVAEAAHEEVIAVDDVTGVELNPEMVKAARKAEIEYFRKMKVYKKVPISKCFAMTGQKPIGVRWIDVNKQDHINPKYRSRLVARQFNKSADLDMFAGTPWLEALRSLISIAASPTNQNILKIMVNDVSRAYFYAPCLTPTFVEICEEDFEDGDEDKCGELLVSMYGTRPAASNWHTHYSGILLKLGFKKGSSNSCIFWHPGKDIKVMVHGDDFVSVGIDSSLKWMSSELEKQFEVSTQIVGPERDDQKQVKVLNRIIKFTDEGIVYEPDPRHAELIVKELGLDFANPVVTPGCDEKNDSTKSRTLDDIGKKRYQSIVARGNFLALDRPDIQFAVKECAQHMSSPRHRGLGEP